MPNKQTISFQDALDAVESLPEYQQEDLIYYIKYRLRNISRIVLFVIFTR